MSVRNCFTERERKRERERTVVEIRTEIIIMQ